MIKTHEEIVAYIFKNITTNWNGSAMLFPIKISEEKGVNVVIEGSEIVKVIEEAIVKAKSA